MSIFEEIPDQEFITECLLRSEAVADSYAQTSDLQTDEAFLLRGLLYAVIAQNRLNISILASMSDEESEGTSNE